MVWAKIRARHNNSTRYVWKRFASRANAQKMCDDFNKVYPYNYLTLLSVQKTKPENIVVYGRGLYCSHKGVWSLD